MSTYNTDPSSTRSDAKRVGNNILYGIMKAAIDGLRLLIKTVVGK